MNSHRCIACIALAGPRHHGSWTGACPATKPAQCSPPASSARAQCTLTLVRPAACAAASLNLQRFCDSRGRMGGHTSLRAAQRARGAAPPSEARAVAGGALPNEALQQHHISCASGGSCSALHMGAPHASMLNGAPNCSRSRTCSESRSVTSHSGRAMARMIPGRPAPEPTSISRGGPAAAAAGAAAAAAAALCTAACAAARCRGLLPRSQSDSDAAPRCFSCCCCCCCAAAAASRCWARQRSMAGRRARLSFTCRSYASARSRTAAAQAWDAPRHSTQAGGLNCK